MSETHSSMYRFSWETLGDIAQGRPNLGPLTPVTVYRLMQYTLKDVLEARYGAAQAKDAFIAAGTLAGKEFCRNVLDKTLDFDAFTAQLQEKLKTLLIGVLRIEKADMESLEFVLTVEEDLDCSGLPVLGEAVCDYDEGFIAGLLTEYTGREFQAREIDCWATGDRTCRFAVRPLS